MRPPPYPDGIRLHLIVAELPGSSRESRDFLSSSLPSPFRSANGAGEPYALVASYRSGEFAFYLDPVEKHEKGLAKTGSPAG